MSQSQATELNEMEVIEREMKPRPTRKITKKCRNTNTDQNVDLGTGFVTFDENVIYSDKVFQQLSPASLFKGEGSWAAMHERGTKNQITWPLNSETVARTMLAWPSLVV